MSISPVANRSFLHGDRKPSESSEKIVYATLDSLALKRATLPLQLLPVDDSNVPMDRSKKEGKSCTEANTKKSSLKVTARRLLSSKQHGKYLLVVPETNPEAQETRSRSTDKDFNSVLEQLDRSEHGACSLRVIPDADKNDIADTWIRVAGETDANGNQSTSNGYCSSNDESLICSNSASAENESSSNDYEQIESTFATDPYWNLRKEANEDAFVKSKSTNDLVSKSCLDAKITDTLSETKLTEELFFESCEKKKRHFTRNVLHLVPEYLVKGPKRRRQKKKGSLGGSLSSLKAFSVESKIGTNLNDRYKSSSLSREEIKYLKISSPTNFVHVASATNPNLVSNENTVRFNFEQVVITHEQKCAILPLLVASSYENSMSGNRTERTSMGAFKGMDSFHALSKERSTRKDGALDLANLKRELLSELQARSTTKALESGQRVKTMPESTCSLSRAESLANSSFLWSSRTNNRLENTIHLKSSPTGEANENMEDADSSEQYDDVGPLNLISQDDGYDDVGMPMSRRIGEPSVSLQDSDDIYDDVVGPTRYTGNVATGNEIEVATNGGEENSYPFVSNEYSSVDEDTMENDQDVYDDVGLPSEERVNSLYAGSTTRSILGSTWTNGKESEWEDLEDSTTTVALSHLASKNSFSWTRKTRKQRSRLSRKSARSSSKSMPCESAFNVAVSLGRGSVLLVGCTEKIEEWKKEEREDRTGQENPPRTQGLVQMRVIDLDEDVDTQETSCYVHEDNASDDSTYESLRSFQPDDFSTDSETEKMDETEQKLSNGLVIAYLEAPTRPNPPPPREVSLTRTLGRRIKRTWSITKGSLSRMRRRTSVDDEHPFEENKQPPNDHSNLDGGRYFSFTRHFKKSVTGPFSTFYLNGYTANDCNNDCTTPRSSYEERNDSSKEPTYSNDSNVGKQEDRYSILADQEPLYQFYAAAVARVVALDSNSDDYEEVEGIAPSRSTTDLAKPGHKTLWCQTPQVMASGLLHRLSPEEKKIQEAKFEILTSEASYLNSLRVLRNEFLDEPSIDEILIPSEKDKLFGGIPDVLQKSEQFLAELEAVWRQDPMLHGLPDVLLKHADRCLDIYVAYCSNQVSIDTTLKDLRTRKGLKFVETISQVEARSPCQSLSLHSFLMLPMQRITRLPLLADAVLSRLPVQHDDRPYWENALSSLNYVVAECNEGARAAVNEIEMENLARKLEYSVKIKPILLKGKHLVKSGSVVQLSTKTDTEYKLTFGKRFNKTPLYLLLLTDYLLVAKYKSNSTHGDTYTVIDTCKRSLIALESVPEDSPFAGRNAMLLTLLENHSGHQVEYILTCESDTERQRWLEAVSPSKRGLIGETLYEVWDCPQVVALYCYFPNQSDELSLHPGDVINVFRKMSDGWYHGEKLLNGEQGWFPGNYAKEVASEHVRAKNLKQRHRFLAISGNVLQRKTKQQ